MLSIFVMAVLCAAASASAMDVLPLGDEAGDRIYRSLPFTNPNYLISPGTKKAIFYGTTKRGLPLDNDTLPWLPQHADLFPKRLYFNLEFEDGLLFRLKLTRNNNLLNRKSHKHATSNLRRDDTNCLFSGHVIDDITSAVAMNLCNGMGSLMSIYDGEFIIQPVTESEIHQSTWELRLIRNALDTDYSTEPMNGGVYNVSELHPQEPRLRRNTRRARRSAEHHGFDNQKRNIEILVVADHSMVEKYGTEEATTYILTVMNMVSSVFQDKTLGAELDIVLAGLIFLTGNETDLEIGHLADQTLNSFCKWQSSLKDTLHHDHAILMTGVDLCVDRDAPCDTIGYAPIRGMCSSTRSCTVNEDRGLGVAFTIAHELGHNLGMIHDGDINNCTEEGSIMGPSLSTNTGTFFWSRCNQKQLSNFLRSPQSECLLNEAPVKTEQYNMSLNELPGQVYNADQQCKHLYGDHATVCKFELPNGVDICRYLWCYVGGMRCETKFLPAAEGTPCDTNKWCREGECISQSEESPHPVEGGWTNWTEWSECTKTCGAGVRSRIRYCSNPSPRYGGDYCFGDSKDYERCNVEECQDAPESFRAQQCSDYDNKPFKGRLFEWSPVDSRYLAKSDQCKLFCRAAKYNFFFQMNDQVTDGTRCDDNSNNMDMCINGKCQPVGCDGVIWSKAQSDKCGVCNGDGTTCETVRGIFIEQDISLNNYTTFLTLPAGAKNIHIKELRASSSFLAIKSGHKYSLNGQWSMDWPGKFKVAGADFSYNRLFSGLEMLYSTGPINHSVEIQILAVATNPGVQYEYVIPLNQSVERYAWRTRASNCTETCGGGYQDVRATCHNRLTTEQVDAVKCAREDKPAMGRFMCNTDPCNPRWQVSEWGTCTKQCGGGKQRRGIECMQRFGPNDDRVIRSKHCKRMNRPPKNRRCNTQACEPEWTKGNWSECSASCGAGLMRRSVYCTSQEKREQVLPDNACKKTKPHVFQRCENRECLVDWYITHWNLCSATCGEGTQIRQVVCISREPNTTAEPLDSSLCLHIPRPNVALQRTCVLNQYCPRWQVTEWGACAQPCGESQRTRTVTCVNPRGQLTNGCDNADKPTSVQRCALPSCDLTTFTSTTTSTTTVATTPKDNTCTDKKSWCEALSVYKYYCTRDYYRTVCCDTCNSIS